jgi:signal transduction histidine kinase
MKLSSRAWLRAACFAAVAAIGLVDHVAGVAVTVAPVYLVVIAFAAWHLGVSDAVAVALASTAVSLGGDLTRDLHGEAGWVPYWNAAFRLPVYVATGVLIGKLHTGIRRGRALAESEHTAAQALREAIELRTTFMRAAAHDIRNPVTALLGTALTLERLDDRLTGEERTEFLGRLAEQAGTLERLVADLLDLDRIETSTESPVVQNLDVKDENEHALVETQLRQTHRVVVESNSVQAVADRVMLERMLANLLSNAKRHVPAGSDIWVRASYLDGGLLMVVEDAGYGVASDLQGTVFAPFTRAKASSGKGIGLSLVARFAELQGGRAWVDERPGGGASFQVWLPQRRRTDPAGEHADEMPAPASSELTA